MIFAWSCAPGLRTMRATPSAIRSRSLYVNPPPRTRCQQGAPRQVPPGGTSTLIRRRVCVSVSLNRQSAYSVPPSDGLPKSAVFVVSPRSHFQRSARSVLAGQTPGQDELRLACRTASKTRCRTAGRADDRGRRGLRRAGVGGCSCPRRGRCRGQGARRRRRRSRSRGGRGHNVHHGGSRPRKAAIRNGQRHRVLARIRIGVGDRVPGFDRTAVAEVPGVRDRVSVRVGRAVGREIDAMAQRSSSGWSRDRPTGGDWRAGRGFRRRPCRPSGPAAASNPRCLPPGQPFGSPLSTATLSAATR